MHQYQTQKLMILQLQIDSNRQRTDHENDKIGGRAQRALKSCFGLMFWVPWGPCMGALVGTKWWGKAVAFDCLILSQIGFILTELC